MVKSVKYLGDLTIGSVKVNKTLFFNFDTQRFHEKKLYLLCQKSFDRMRNQCKNSSQIASNTRFKGDVGKEVKVFFATLFNNPVCD